MKKFLSLLMLGSLFVASPILMDHARDIYLEEIVSPKAMSVKIEGQIRASSFQIKHKGIRLTVTNNHVCSAVASTARKNDTKRMNLQIKWIKDFKWDKSIEKFLVEIIRNEFKNKVYPIVGESLTIGEVSRKILYNSDNHDICFLEPVGHKYFSLASSVHRGERVTIIGHPRGRNQSITEGRIVGSGYSDFYWISKAGKVRFLRTTAITYPGNSGSPVINRYGNVVGILFSGYSLDYLNLGGVVPLEYIENDIIAYLGQK